MPTEEAICVTKQSVNDLVRILDQTIDLLDKEYHKQYPLSSGKHGSTFEYDESKEIEDMIIEAKSEREIYKKVQNMMDKKGHITLCLMTSNIPRKGKIKVYTERDEYEDVDSSEVNEPRKESEEPGTMSYF